MVNVPMLFYLNLKKKNMLAKSNFLIHHFIDKYIFTSKKISFDINIKTNMFTKSFFYFFKAIHHQKLHIKHNIQKYIIKCDVKKFF